MEATTDFLDWLDLGFSIADTNGLLRFLDTNAPAYPHRPAVNGSDQCHRKPSGVRGRE